MKNKGKRIIVGYGISGQTGPLKNCELIVTAGANVGDYHEQMNHQMFENWMSNTVFPLIKAECPDGKITIVYDNAPYHSWQLDKVCSHLSDVLKSDIQSCINF